MSVLYIWHSSNVTLYNDPDSFYGAHIWTVEWPIKYISTLIPDERTNALQKYSMVSYILDASGQGSIIMEFYIVCEIILICLSVDCSIYKLKMRDTFRRHEIAPTP